MKSIIFVKVSHIAIKMFCDKNIGIEVNQGITKYLNPEIKSMQRNIKY